MSITVSLILAGFSRHFHFVLICFIPFAIYLSLQALVRSENPIVFFWVVDFVVPGAVCDCQTGIFDIPGLIALLDPFDCGFVRFYELHVPSMPSPSR